MKEVIFNKKTYMVPCSWQEVSLGMVIKVSELDDIIEEAPIISIICGYTGIKDNELRICSMPEVKPILELLDFIYTPYEPQPATAFEFKGEKYMVMESLEKAEFQDWVSSQTVIYQYRDKPVQALPKLIAILCKKDGESLSDFDIEERSQMFLELPITTARDLECFFLHCLRAYNAVTLLYSTIPEQEAIVLNKFLELGNTMKQRQVELGWYSPTRFVIGIYRRYLLYLKRQLEKSFNSKYTEISRKNWIQTSKELLTKRFAGNIRVSKQ